MTIPSSGPISFSQISTDNADGFGLGYSMAAYRGQIYDNKAGGAGAFSTGAISLGDFYGKRRVDGNASGVAPTSSPYTIPVYKTITIVVRGAGGQGGGGGGSTNDTNNCNTPGAGGGNSGSASSFGSSGNAWYMTAAGGGGGTGGSGQQQGINGTQGADGAGYDGAVARANGGTGSTTGGKGGGGGKQTITLTNPALGGTGPTSGSTIAFSLGSCSPASNHGEGRYYSYNGLVWTCGYNGGSNGSDGSAGAAGSLLVTWTGT